MMFRDSYVYSVYKNHGMIEKYPMFVFTIVNHQPIAGLKSVLESLNVLSGLQRLHVILMDPIWLIHDTFLG